MAPRSDVMKPRRLQRLLAYFGLAVDPPGNPPRVGTADASILQALAELRYEVARNTAAIDELRERLDR